jgi:uncharacterized SAM-binding protein YcdF (DUF218 family)
VIARALAMLALVYALGFLWFAAALPQPLAGGKTDAVVVPTGGAGRIARGLEILRAGTAREMLVTGVDREVKPNEFAAEHEVSARTMRCCITLGFAAVDTRSNAAETAAWMNQRNYRSLRLVTTDWHMRRAARELARTLPDDVAIVRDAVPSRPRLRVLFLEYNKLLASALAQVIPD